MIEEKLINGIEEVIRKFIVSKIKLAQEICTMGRGSYVLTSDSPGVEELASSIFAFLKDNLKSLKDEEEQDEK